MSGGSIVRDRGCMYYVPWIATASLCLLGAAVGIWVHFGMLTYDDTKGGLDALGISAMNMERPKPAIIATACFSLFLVLMLAALSLARSFIEAAHDATGQVGSGSGVWLVFAVLVQIPWWLIIFWLVVLIGGCCVWAGLIYVLKEAINSLLVKYGPQPIVAYVPSAGLPCPSQCLNLDLFKYLSTSFDNTCICQYDKLRAAKVEFDDAYHQSTGMLVGVWLIFAACLLLLVNFACQYSHTVRERDYLRRLTNKQFISV